MIRRLDIEKIKTKNAVFISTKESLHDVTPIAWSNDVLAGKKKVVVTKAEE